MVEREHEPTDIQEDILEALKEGRDGDAPWGYANPSLLEDKTGHSKQKLNYHLQGLLGARWVVKPSEGLYKFVEDPREESQEDQDPQPETDESG